ncbi:MAG: AmmeMemoRadiSam system radical SAM enzyme [Candidatus Gottesmanbacteria bacterium]
MHEAVYYQKLDKKRIRCQLCSHRCLILPGKRGICSVRENRNGTLYTLVYGLVIAANVDPIEKKPFFHFLPGSKSFSIATAGCNFRCKFCQNWEISQLPKNRGEGLGFVPHASTEPDLNDSYTTPDEIVKQALFTNCQSIAYTYTEPTIFFEYAIDTAKLAKKAGLTNVFVSNGYQTPETIKQMAGLIDAVNIDLKSFSDEFYQQVCGARLQPVLDSIKLMHNLGIWVEITTLLVPGQNDSPDELSKLAKFIASVDKNIPWHISRFHPDYQLTDMQPTPLKTLESAYAIGKGVGLNYIYIGNVIDDKHESTYCPKCNNLAIKRVGYDINIIGINNKDTCQKCGYKFNLKLSVL